MKGGDRIPTDGGAPLGQNPFAHLGDGRSDTGKQDPNAGQATANTGNRIPPESIRSPVSEIPNAKNRGRVDITRQTAGRGGKTVTVVSGFVGIGLPEKEQLARRMQKVCGCGGTVKDGCIEIQGDKREPVAKILAAAGFRPVFAGG
jgi:translation initiation factor 1